MKVYEVGEQGKPVLMLLPGTGCYWRSNFGKVIEPLAETFRWRASLTTGLTRRNRRSFHDDRGDGEDRGIY